MSAGLVTMAANQSLSREVNRICDPAPFNLHRVGISCVLSHQSTSGFMNYVFIKFEKTDDVNADVLGFVVFIIYYFFYFKPAIERTEI